MFVQHKREEDMRHMTHKARHAECVSLTFVVQRAIEVVAASVEAGGQLDEVASPRVAGAREAG